MLAELGIDAHWIQALCCAGDLSGFAHKAFQFAGLIGVAFYLGGYAALQFGYIRGNSKTYALTNLFGASLVLVSLFAEFNMASALIQISWILISVTGLTRRWFAHRKLWFTEEETAFLAQRLPDLPIPAARRLWNAGTWFDALPGHQMLKEGEPVATLYYLAQGAADVTLSGQHLAQVNQGFLGEINVSTGACASATVTVAVPSRMFAISRDALIALHQGDPDLRLALERSMMQDTGRKLLASNAQLSTGQRGASVPASVPRAMQA